MENQLILKKTNTPVGKVIYTGATHTTGGREGSSKSSDGALDVTLTSPGKGGGTNPEQLFAAGWSACFLGAMKKAAATMNVALPENAAVDAEVDLVLKGEDYSLNARLNIVLPGIGYETSIAIANAAHGICPYSKATRGNIGVAINVVK